MRRKHVGHIETGTRQSIAAMTPPAAEGRAKDIRSHFTQQACSVAREPHASRDATVDVSQDSDDPDCFDVDDKRDSELLPAFRGDEACLAVGTEGECN